MKRRILAWTLVVSLLLSLVPAYAETDAEEWQTEEPTVEATVGDQAVDGTGELENAELVTQEPLEDVEPENGEEPEVTEADDPEESEEDMSTPFYASVRIELMNMGDIFFGDEVVLHAIVDANQSEYAVVWQYYNENAQNDGLSEEWLVCGSGETLSLIVTEVTAARVFRAVVNDQFVSGMYMLPTVSEKPEEEVDPEEDEPEAEEPAEDVPSHYPYTYVRGEGGELVLDESGNPIAIVPEGVDIPVAFLRDEAGNLVLDAAGNPIPTQFVPQTAHKVVKLEDQLDPNRSIDIYADWGDGPLYFNMESTLIAVLHGYDNAVYTIQWQTSVDGNAWIDVENATEANYTMVVTEDNYADYWRVVVTITDVIESDEAL